MKIFEETYNGESMVDVSRDVWEAFDERFNPEMKKVPTSEDGFCKGEFKVTIVWTPEETL